MAANFSGLPDKQSSQCHEIISQTSTASSNNYNNNHIKETTTKTTTTKTEFGTAKKQPNSSCSCSNIQIMQLFHEMKQEYPTVPDHMVSQLVTENCHDRPKCMEKLAEIEEEYAQTAQAFPSQSIRYNKPPTPPRRCKNVHRQAQTQQQQQQQHKRGEPDTNNEEKLSAEKPEAKIEKVPPPTRPNFLALRKEPSPLPFTRKAPNPPRPIRAAPPPPISATAAITTDPSSPIQEPLNVSLNVTVSPVPQRRPRHTSELNVQPEMPYTTPPSPGGPRSYTSVNFTLRPPSEENVQSPIDICAGPSLTYSSSSYDARQGYQSSLKITVGGPGLETPTAFSAMRTRAQSCYDVADPMPILSIPQQRLQQEILNHALRPGISLPNVHTDTKGIVVSPLREDEVVRRQLDRKRGLDNELQRDKHRLENLEYEILILKANFTTSDLERLIEEIKLLQRECDYMTELLDKAGVTAFGDPMVAMGNANLFGQQRSITSGGYGRATTKPPRPPLPAALRTTASPQRPSAAPPPTPQTTTFNYGPSFYSGSGVTTESMDLPWTCSACTFQNHPLLNRCEQCEVPRIPSGTVNSISPCIGVQQASASYQRPSASPYLNGGGGQTPATPFSPHLYPNSYAPAYPYANNLLNPEARDATNNSQSVGDLPSATNRQGHRHTPSM